MKKLLIIPMAIFELVFWLITAVILLINIKLGTKFMRWAMENIPDKEYYFKGEI